MNDKQKYVQIYLSYLIPGQPPPCDIYIHFKGRYLLVITEASEISFDFMAKMHNEGNHFCYVRADKHELWNKWCRVKHTAFQRKFDDLFQPLTSSSSQQSKYISFAVKNIIVKEISTEVHWAANATDKFRKTVNHPSLNWFFSSNVEEHRFFHSATTTYLLSLFWEYVTDSKLIEASDNEFLLMSSIIHNLNDGAIKEENKCTSEISIEYLKSKGFKVGDEVIRLLKKHNELIDGSGHPEQCKGNEIPLEVKVFSIVDSFEHFMNEFQGTGGSTSKTKHALELMATKLEQFDADLVGYFRAFISSVNVLL